MKVIIISLNSVIDHHYYFNEFICNKENFATQKLTFAAGKGVNVAKTLKVLNVPHELFLLLGEENKDEFNALLKNDSISAKTFYTKGRTRENISIHANNICETRLCNNTFKASNEACEVLFNSAIKETSSNEDNVIVISGRLPHGISKEHIIKTIKNFKEKNKKIIIDSASFDLDDYKEISPYLIKPNEEEIKLFGKDMEDSIRNLLLAGVKNIAVSLGEKGIVLYSKNSTMISVPQKIKPLSTVGAGDSSIAGFVCGLVNGFSMEKTLKLAVSCGTANCLSPGGNTPTKENIKHCFQNIDFQNKT